MADYTLTLNALKLTSAMLVAVALPLGAIASDGPEDADMPTDMEMHTPQTDWSLAPAPARADYFAAADLDGSGSLGADEYIVFADTLADRGDSDMAALQASGLYSESFITADKNADGVLTYDEVPQNGAETSEQAEQEADTLILPDAQSPGAPDSESE